MILEKLEQRTFLDAVNVNINTAQTLQTMQGMGAAMIPWDMLPEYKDPAFFDLIVNDLGASMARASILPAAEKVNDNNDPNVFNFAAFDHTALGTPMEFFKQMQVRGVDRFVGSVWTAPAWMKTNQLFTDGGSLRPDMYAEYAEYLSAVVQLAKNDWGINLTALSPQNEPYFVEPYESTTYNALQFREMLRAVVKKFSADSIKTQLLLPEDLIFEDRNKWYVSKIMEDPETKNFIGNFAGHGLSAHWPEIRDTLAPYGREFWMTETSGNSNTWEGAIGLANGIMNAIGTANASTYLYWQFSEKAGNEKFSLMSQGQPTVKYYAAKQFYRYIRPGFVHVGTQSSLPDQLRAESFRDPSTGAITTVIVNRDGDTHDVSFNLAGSGLPGTYKVFRSSKTENFASLGTITGGSAFNMTIPGLSVVTITNAPELTPKTGGAVGNVTPAKVSNYISGSNFFTAAMKGYNDSLTAQILGGANVNQTRGPGWTPLHAAAGSAHTGSITTLNTLLANGASVTALNNDGWTPLHAAAANTFPKFGGSPTLITDKINALITAGADVNAKDNAGRTALMWAAMMGKFINFTQDPSVVQALLARGANPFLTDNAGKTALDYANANGYDRLADKLIAAMGTDTKKPTGDVVDVTPDPRNTSVTDFVINFSERVEGFDLTDIVLSRDGTIIPFATGIELLTDDDIHFQLKGLGGLTSIDGTFILIITAAGSGITDPSGNPLAADFSDTWTKGNVTPPPTTQTPFLGSPFAVGTTPVTVQLEDYDNGGEGVAYHDLESKNQGNAYRTTFGVDVQPATDTGGGFNVGYTKAGEWIEYTINVAQAGNYDFDFRLASTGNNGKFHAEIDGANVTGTLTVPNSGGYQTWQTLSKTGIALTAGQHILRVALDTASSNGSIGNFNWLKISPSGTTPPPPDPQTPFSGLPFAVGTNPVTIQVEDFDNGGEGVAYHDLETTNLGASTYRPGAGVDIEVTGDTGGGLHVGYTKVGEWLEYTINVAASGTYNFDFRAASSGVGGKFRALIDGIDKTGQLTVPDTGGWNTFATVSKTNVQLDAGQHVLRLAIDTVGAAGFAGNFNSIKITPVVVNPPTSTTITSTNSAYTRGGSSANTNFGSDPTLIVKKHSDFNSQRESFIKFDLTGVSTITAAKLRLFGSLNDTSSTSVQSQVFGGASTTWDETTLTWNTRPATIGSALATVIVTGTTQQWYEFDVTAFLQAEKAAGRNVVTLVLRNPTQQNALVVFNSDDTASNRPELKIN